MKNLSFRQISSPLPKTLKNLADIELASWRIIEYWCPDISGWLIILIS